MFCPKCGTENPETGRFCRNCGTDLGNVSSALSGGLATRNNQNQVLISSKGKPITWEGATVKVFTGIAFFVVTIALALSQMGRGWWFWMLIPAFTILGGGIAQIIQLKKHEKNQPIPTANQQNQVQSNHTNLNLPPTQTEYVKPQGSIYDTGELIAPTSVTENTTRHLEINKEGETMTLPKK